MAEIVILDEEEGSEYEEATVDAAHNGADDSSRQGRIFRIKSSGSNEQLINNRMILTCLMIVSLIAYNAHGHLLTSNIIITTLICFAIATELVIFDSAALHHPNSTVLVKAISLAGVKDCSDVKNSYSDPVDISVQILTIPNSALVTTYQCVFQYTAFTQTCDSNLFRSDIYPRETIALNQQKIFTTEQCKEFYTKKSVTFTLFGRLVTILNAGRSRQSKEVLLFGQTFSKRPHDGGCIGKYLTIAGEEHKNAIVSAQITYSVTIHKARYSVPDNLLSVEDKIIFPVGSSDTVCDTEFGCFTIERKDLPNSRCERSNSIFLGSGKIFYPQTESGEPSAGYQPILTVQSHKDNTQGVSLMVTGKSRICGHTVLTSTIDNLYINVMVAPQDEITHRLSGNGTDSGSQIEKLHMDLLSSFTSIHIQGSLDTTSKFDAISKQLCETQRQNLKNVIRDILTAESSQLLNLRTGLVFRRVASISYIYSGPAMRVKLRTTKYCYSEIPVEFMGADNVIIEAWATSKGRILVQNSTRVDCSAETPMHFLPALDEDTDPSLEVNNTLMSLSHNPQIGSELGRWICQAMDRFYECAAPEILSPTHNQANFNGIKPRFMRQSLFGQEGRQELFSSQMRDFDANVLMDSLGQVVQGKQLMSNANNILVHLDQNGQNMLRQIVYPDLYFLFGKYLHWCERIAILSIAISMVINLVSLIFRLKNMLTNYSCSCRLFYAIFQQFYVALLPLAQNQEESMKLSEANQRVIVELREQLARLQHKTDSLVLAQLSPPKISQYGNESVPFSTINLRHLGTSPSAPMARKNYEQFETFDMQNQPDSSDRLL